MSRHNGAKQGPRDPNRSGSLSHTIIVRSYTEPRPIATVLRPPQGPLCGTFSINDARETRRLAKAMAHAQKFHDVDLEEHKQRGKQIASQQREGLVESAQQDRPRPHDAFFLTNKRIYAELDWKYREGSFSLPLERVPAVELDNITGHESVVRFRHLLSSGSSPTFLDDDNPIDRFSPSRSLREQGPGETPGYAFVEPDFPESENGDSKSGKTNDVNDGTKSDESEEVDQDTEMSDSVMDSLEAEDTSPDAFSRMPTPTTRGKWVKK
ncbi:hypothetical protein K491DRAFT_715085 [Lophiostoma macrostomum CBS 122681]|uniref:Uncharacterized protein n=1 Tax=Lophiostoma macrostomum CBS 122681 TaxID=1314788 RepID=A0A6A6TA45_9PLEO|nr:hypothetical protein K491DRAFT_715085 [Lophiostoma macrostomum CBS 122681]